MMTKLAAALSLVLQVLAPNVETGRVDAIASDIVEVVVKDDKSDEGLPMEKTEAASMLAAAIFHESGLRESVETCKSSGDGGRSIGLGQVMVGQNWEGHTKKEICSNRKLQLKLALHVLSKCYERTPRSRSVYKCYTSGDAGVDSPVARAENATFLKIDKAIKSFLKRREEISMN